MNQQWVPTADRQHFGRRVRSKEIEDRTVGATDAMRMVIYLARKIVQLGRRNESVRDFLERDERIRFLL